MYKNLGCFALLSKTVHIGLRFQISHFGQLSSCIPRIVSRKSSRTTYKTWKWLYLYSVYPPRNTYEFLIIRKDYISNFFIYSSVIVQQRIRMTSPLRKQTKSISHLLAAVLALSSLLTCTASESKSTATLSADQYHPYRSDELLKSRHRFGKSNGDSSSLGNHITVPDLQVGCGDGVFVERTTAKPVESKLMSALLTPKERTKREALAGHRTSKGYYYTVFTPSSLSYTAVFRPQTYRLQRPYYIPVWGSQDYPPAVPAVPPTTTTKPPPPPPVDPSILGERFASTMDGSPIWDSRPAAPAAPAAEVAPVPTRRPNRPKTSTFPPLIHQLSPTTAPPVVPAAAPEFDDKISDIFGAPPPPSPALPTAQIPTTTSPIASNQCAWAIINCCSAGSMSFNTACFERLGCPGPFWDRSPCESDFAKNAIKYALEYYKEK
ncbi:hypothetical protein Trydic_g10201 [Trypoxylus dichotomus]